MIETKELELETSLTVGSLTSNAAKIKAYVDGQLKNYDVSFYVGKVEEAKKDRAELNKAADKINALRLELEKDFNKPFADFKATINGVVKSIKAASVELDKIVKAEESREKEEKRAKIEEIWKAQAFDLVPLEKIFNPQWLNKTCKLNKVEAEIKEKISNILDDLDIISNFPPEDVPLIKANYLETLNVSDATRYAASLKTNRDRLANEQIEKQKHAIAIQLDEQKAEEMADISAAAVADCVGACEFAPGGQLLENAPTNTPPVKESYAVIFSGTREQLLRMREYMTAQGITYTKLIDTGDGTFTM